MKKIETFISLDLIEQRHYKFIRDTFIALDIKNEVTILNPASQQTDE